MKPVLAVRHVPHEGLGTIAQPLQRLGLATHIIDAFAGILPRFEPDQWAGLIVMGGPMNVDEVNRYPFLAQEIGWLERAVKAGMPILGVCLGAQLLAKTLGARVYANRVKEIGWYEVEMLPAAADDCLLGGIDEPQVAGKSLGKITVFQWHGDTFDLPTGAVQLARSGQCENQAFRFGSSAYGLQFHMEVTSEIIDSWLCESGNCGELVGLSYIDPSAIRRATPQKLPQMQSLGSTVFERFAEICRQNA